MCQRNPGVCMKPYKHMGRYTGAPKNSEFAETIYQSYAILCQRHPGVCMKSYKHVGGCTAPRCKKTYGCMKQFEHSGECKDTNTGLRCKTVGYFYLLGHEGDCNTSENVGPRCKSFGCLFQPGHEGSCNTNAIVLRCKTHTCLQVVGHVG
jgi:hypothetical protein